VKQQKISVLLVEPEKTVHSLVPRILGGNYEVTTVTDRGAAMNLITEGRRYDLVIMNGEPLGSLPAFIELVRTGLGSVKIILMTGYGPMAKGAFDVDGLIAEPHIWPLRSQADTFFGLS
jgi:CheY-like chemotaxis protein